MIAVTVPAAGGTMPAKPSPTGSVTLKGPLRGRPPKSRQAASREACRFAAAILEVLAGLRTPTDAATAMGVSVARYYLWEQRALEGLVAACEPRPGGKVASHQHEIALLQKEVARLRQDCARQQALVRASHRTVGLGPPLQATLKPGSKAADKASGRSGGKVKRKRRPVARALKAAATLRTAPSLEETATSSSSAVTTEVLQRSVVTNPSTLIADGAGVLPALATASEGSFTEE